MKVLMTLLLSVTACFPSTKAPAEKHRESVGGSAATGKGSLAAPADVKRQASEAAAGSTPNGVKPIILGETATKSVMSDQVIKKAAALLQEHCPREYLTILQGGTPGLRWNPIEPLSPEQEETQIELAYQQAYRVLHRAFDETILKYLIKLPGATDCSVYTLAECLDLADADWNKRQFKHPMKVAELKQLVADAGKEKAKRQDSGCLHRAVRKLLNPEQAKYELLWVVKTFKHEESHTEVIKIVARIESPDPNEQLRRATVAQHKEPLS